MRMPEVSEKDDFNPKKIFNDLLKRCKEAKQWQIRCIVDESWIPKGNIPFNLIIRDGIYFCNVIAPTQKEAYLIVANSMPVITFLTDHGS